MSADAEAHANDPHAADLPGHDGSDGGHHATDDHGGDHGHDDHGHAEEPLGPIDVAAWGAGIIGVAAGAVVAVGFALATGAIAV